MGKSDFWGKKDSDSMARSLRLAIIQNVYDQDFITEEQAKGLLKGRLSPVASAVYYDDSDCLKVTDV